MVQKAAIVTKKTLYKCMYKLKCLSGSALKTYALDHNLKKSLKLYFQFV